MDFIHRHYMKHNLQQQIKELYFSITVRNLAISMISIFEPIYLYRLYGSIQVVFLFYTALYLLYFFTIPLGAKAAARYGFEHCIFYSTPFLIMYYLSLSLLEVTPNLIFFALLCIVADKTLLRPAYHADMAHYGKTGYRGREVGALSFLESFSGMLGPVVGGILLTLFGFKILFILVSLIILSSTVPMLSTKEKFKPAKFSYREAMNNFLKPRGIYKRRDSMAFAGYGEELIVSQGWPVFISLFLAGFHTIGFVVSAASVLVALVKLYAGRISDKLTREKKRKWVAYNTALYAGLNFCRPFVNNWLGVLSVNFLSNTLKSGITYPYFTFIYSAAGTDKSFLKYSVFYEMSLSFGKFIVGSSLLVLSLYFTGLGFWYVAFILAGLWSLLFSLLKF